MARKKRETPPQAEQFEEVAPPTAGSFTTSTPNPVSGRIVSGSDTPESSAPTSEAPTAESLVGQLAEVDRLSKVGREISEGPVRKGRKNAPRTPGVAKAEVPINFDNPADSFRLKILADINADEFATHIRARKLAITRAANTKLTGLYKAHEDQGGCKGNSKTAKTCPTRLGIRQSRKEFLKSHPLDYVNKAKNEAEALATHEYDNEKDPITGELVNAFKPRTLDTLDTHQQQHVERVYKLADMLHEDHKARVAITGGKELGKEHYSPDKVLSAVNALLSSATGKTYYKTYVAGLGKRIRTVADTAGTMEQLPSIGTEVAQKFSHQGLVSALFDSMNKARSRPLQLLNPGSGTSRRLAAAGSPEARKAIMEAYEDETAIHRGGAAPFIEDLHKILTTRAAEKGEKATIEGARQTGIVDNDTARTLKAMAVEEHTGQLLPKTTGEQLDAQNARTLAERQERYEDHEAQHSATQKTNLAKLGRKGSKQARASAIINTCHSDACNAARAKSENGSIDIDTWARLHETDTVAPTTRIDESVTQAAASENRRRINAALAPRTPGAVADLVGQGNTTASGAGTTVPNNNADDAVDRLSDIQKQIQSGAILIPGSRDVRPRGQISDDRPGLIKPILNRNILSKHFDTWTRLPKRIQQHMLTFPVEHHDRFLRDYQAHNANERSKVQAADKAGTMYTPQDFTFNP